MGDFGKRLTMAEDAGRVVAGVLGFLKKLFWIQNLNFDS
jgi:hypothetical protein